MPFDFDPNFDLISAQPRLAPTPRTWLRTWHAAVLALLLVAASPLAAQQAPGNAGGANARAGAPARGGAAGDAPPTGAERHAAAQTAANQLRGAGDEQSLLGAPRGYRDPYQSALDANETQQTELMKAERVPSGGTNANGGNGYDPLPPGGRRPLRAADANGAAAAPATTPQEAAQAAYRDSFNGQKTKAAANGLPAAQPVYKSPW